MDKNKAYDIVKESSFLDYVEMNEANVDMGGTARSSSTSGFSNFDQNAKSTKSSNSKEFDSNLNNNKKQRSKDQEFEVDGEDGMIVKINNGKAELYKNGKKIDDESNAKKDNKSFFNSSAWKKMKSAGNAFSQGFSKGLREARQTLNLDESITTANIASAPSVVGDTSDSHKPTVQLRKRMKTDKHEEKIKNNKKKRKKKNNEKEREDKIYKDKQ